MTETIINVKAQEEYYELMEILEKQGYRLLFKGLFERYLDDTCIEITEENELWLRLKNNVKYYWYNIISLQEYKRQCWIEDSFEEGERVLVKNHKNYAWQSRIFINFDKSWKALCVGYWEDNSYKNDFLYNVITWRQIKKISDTITITSDNGEKLEIDRETAENLWFNIE